MVSVGSASCFMVIQVQCSRRLGGTRSTMAEASTPYRAAVPEAVKGLNVYFAA